MNLQMILKTQREGDVMTWREDCSIRVVQRQEILIAHAINAFLKSGNEQKWAIFGVQQKGLLWLLFGLTF